MIQIPGYQSTENLYESKSVRIVRALQADTGKRVILKILRAAYPGSTELAFFKREFEIGAKLKPADSREICTLEKYGNRLMIVQEDFGGMSLDKILSTTRLSLPQLLGLFINISKALALIHRHNIIHKNINPSNIVWNPATDRLRIIDFGLASELPRENPEIRALNVMEGSLAYMSPEQTGRMNRPMDYRTDFYSLGVNLYQMATGVLPFQTADPLELVHCHIARTPAPPQKQNPDIPPVLSDIIMKLLAKNAEDRYQGAAGLINDLTICQEQIQSVGKISHFQIGRTDVSDKFQIPQKLYGREQEIRALLGIFENVRIGKKEMMKVCGLPGIGKSAVIHEIQKSVIAGHGFFVFGKYDLLEHNIPYRAIIQAFRQLIEQILTESEAGIADWKEKLKSALGPNGQVLVDILPELEMLIGPQPELERLPLSEAQNRFNIAFVKFVNVFSKQNHPLVLFLDDLQWADAASLKLIEILMASNILHHFFLIVAFRENEVLPGHPVTLTLDDIAKSGHIMHTLSIKPLSLDIIRQLLADTLLIEPDHAAPLAEAIYIRTQGNPFFTIQFIQSLYKNGVVFFDPPSQRWGWHPDKIKDISISGDVIDLMIQKIRELPEKTIEVLQLAACIGNRFDLKTLSIISRESIVTAAANLWPAMQEGLIQPIGGEYKLLADLGGAFDSQVQHISSMIIYQFLHDRVQQAAYSLIPDNRKQQTHLTIGRQLVNGLSVEAREEKLFDIVNQINYATDLLSDDPESLLMAELNWKAGKRAVASNAYESALNYLNNGRQLLPPERWQTDYDLMLELHKDAANAAYLSGHFTEMEDIVQTGFARATHLHDAIAFHETRIQAYFAQNRPIDVVREGLQVLQELGYRFPSRPNDLHALRELIRIKWMMKGRRIQDLYQAPDMQDRDVSAVYRILPHLGSSAYRALPKLLPLVVFEGVKLFLRHGNATESAFFIAAYGMILCGAMDELDIGSRFGDLAFALKERPIGRRFKARTWYLVEGFIRHWKNPLRETLSPLLECYRLGMETGDLEFGTGAAHLYCSYGFYAGKPLPELLPEIAKYSRIIAQLKQEINLNYNEILHQAAINYVKPTDDPTCLAGDIYDEAKMLPVHREVKDETSIYVLYLHKMILSCIFENWDAAIRNAKTLRQYRNCATGLFYNPVRLFYEAIARLALFPTLSPVGRKHALLRLRRIRKKMKKWAAHAPMNHQHRYLLIMAESARAAGHCETAMELYDQAVIQARDNGFLQDESFALERFATFWQARNRTEIAEIYVQKAYYGYQQWGALEKIRHLTKKYPEYLSDIHPGPASESKRVAEVPFPETLSKALDINAFIKASQSISSEIEIKRMLRNLMRIVVENAGAERGILLLTKSGKLFIEAEGTIETTQVLQSVPFETSKAKTSERLPERVIRYVERTSEPVFLDDAARDERFGKDPYIINHALKSVLCMPVMHHGQLTGIFYLENNLAIGAFTPERFEFLKLLASQAAISIENARLYSILEEKIIERTQELAEAQKKIVRLEKEATEIQMAGGFAHEMRNALSGVQKLLGKAFDNSSGIEGTLCYQNAIQLTKIYQELKNSIHTDQLDKLAGPFSVINENEATLDEIIRRSQNRMQRALGIIDQIMEYSRMGKAHPGDQTISLGKIITSLIQEESREEFEDFGIRINVEIDSQKMVKGEESHFYSIIKNILLNARDAAIPIKDPNRKQIDIQLSENETSQVLVIQDYGVGISPENQQKIYEPFFTTKPHTGTGLGLGVVYKLIRLYNGTITVESGIDQGTAFTITLPFVH